MGVLQFFSKEDVFKSFSNTAAQAKSKLYFLSTATLKDGVAVYLDRPLTQKLTAGRWYGIKNYKGANWAFQVNSLSQVVNLTQEKKVEVGWQSMWPLSNLVNTKAVMDAAAAKGMRLYQLNIRLCDVFKNIDQWNSNTGNWAGYDELVNKANSLFDEIYFRIICDFDDTEYYDLTQTPVVPKTNFLFDLFNDIAQDEWYNPGRIGDGSGHASFGKDSARAKMVEFFNKVLVRYVPILGQKFQFASPATSAQQEMGGNFENQYYTPEGSLSPKRRAAFDYHPDNQAKFRAWVMKQYGSLSAAGQAHGKVYTNVSEILPPKTGKPSLLAATDEDIYNLFKTQLGLDWYLHNYLMQKQFWLECKDKLKINAPWAKFVGEFGANDDVLNIVRYCFDLIDISTFCDVIKTKFSGVDWLGYADVAAAIVANNVGNLPIWVEVNENDPVEMRNITDPAQVKITMERFSRSAIANGASKIIFIADKASAYYNNTMDLASETMTFIANNPDYRTTDGAIVNIPISKLIQNYDAAVSDIKNAGLTTALTNRPVVKLIQNVVSNVS